MLSIGLNNYRLSILRRSYIIGSGGVQRTYRWGRFSVFLALSHLDNNNYLSRYKVSMTLATLLFGYFIAYSLAFITGSIIKGVFSLFFYGG